RQIAANKGQGADICEGSFPCWIVGDSRNVESIADGPFDFVLSCPPYGDLERYSDDTRDLSTLPYPLFIEAYRDIIAKSVGMLRKDRFAAFVVGDFRAPSGLYRGFVQDTIEAFEGAGAMLYNDAVLITMPGSLTLRARTPFVSSRKLGKAHQNVL